MTDPIASASRAKSILESDEWLQAWEAYRSRIFEEIEAADSRDSEKILHLKRLLSAGKVAKAHLERLISDGAMAVAELKMDEDKRKAKLFQWKT